MIPNAVLAWLQENGYGEVTTSKSVGGGCISDGRQLKTSSQRTLFLKVNRHAPAAMFAREAEGLEALAVPDGPRVPQPFLFGEDFILLEDLAPTARANDYWPTFGSQLAALHTHTNDQFGFPHDNYIGSTHQPNPWQDDGYAFFAHERLIFQGRLAHQRGLLGMSDLRSLEQLASRLPALVPTQPASLIHGDLWSGNAMADERGRPALIDPAAHFGWAEAELGMTALFGAFPEDFYRAYEKVRNLEPGYRQRFPIYNLYHLLNHLNLFGGGYLSRVHAILRRYG